MCARGGRAPDAPGLAGLRLRQRRRHLRMQPGRCRRPPQQQPPRPPHRQCYVQSLIAWLAIEWFDDRTGLCVELYLQLSMGIADLRPKVKARPGYWAPHSRARWQLCPALRVRVTEERPS